MISKFKLLEKYSNLLLLFLLPTQLGLHFWPKFAFVFGIRVDYLAPTLYLTDVLFISLFVFWISQNWKHFFQDLKNNKIYLLVLILLITVNTVFSLEVATTLIKWLKVGELVLFSYYVKNRKDIFSKKNVSPTLIASLAFFCLIGISQFFYKETLGGLFYFLGERKFSIYTPGIAIVNLFKSTYLRIYSTFPHPNAFAGYIGCVLICLVMNKSEKINVYSFIVYLLILFTLIFTFSLSAYVGVLGTLVFYHIFKKHLYSSKIFSWLFLITVFLSIGLIALSFTNLPLLTNLSASFRERLELAGVSGRILSDNLLIGSGLNTFIPRASHLSVLARGVWLLQPVHNTLLLVLAELGVVGLIVLCFFFMKMVKQLVKRKNSWALMIIVFVLLTGLFDHYWITIQQNLLLISFMFGHSLQDET